jgi:hypothetical protein
MKKSMSSQYLDTRVFQLDPHGQSKAVRDSNGPQGAWN